MSAPTSVHYAHLQRLLRYLRTTPAIGHFFSRISSFQLQAYSDSTWASDPVDRRSITGYCIFLGSSLIAWKSKKQSGVFRSSVEAELHAMAEEIVWLRWLLKDLGVVSTSLTPLYCDNTDAIQIALNPIRRGLSKHIGIDIFFLRDQHQQGTLVPHYLPSKR